MTRSLLILGRQPAIGLAELERLYGADAIQPVGLKHNAAIIDLPPSAIDFKRLGGSMRLAQLVATLDTTEWQPVEKHLRQLIPSLIQHVPDGKLKFGISVYGLNITVSRLNAAGLSLKKLIRGQDRSVRIVPNKELELNSAQVLHNGLTSPTGIELLLVSDGRRTFIAQTTDIQDIDAYAARDQGRPKRDARVGMLPPKLAQIIINLAAGSADPANHVVLDPFCGTGVVLQEALLMGFGVYGTDIEPRMVEYSQQNLDWLDEQYDIATPVHKLEVGDATAHSWNPTPALVACEGYLGQPFTGPPSPAKLADVRSTCNLILKKFLSTIHKQMQPGSQLCVAVPAWQQEAGRFAHLPLLTPGLDHLEELGYNRVSFRHVKPEDLVYARADQIVARELLVITRI